MELKTLFSGVADAIREKDGSTAPIRAADFPQRVRALQAGGGDAEDSLTARLLDAMTSYSNPDIKTVPMYGCSYQTNLKEVSLPACTNIRQGGFYGCTGLAVLDLPELVAIENNSFRNCASLTEFISGSKFNSRIDNSTFEGCSSITKIDLYHVNTLGFGSYSLACTRLTALIIRNTDFVPPLHVSTFGAATTAMNQGAGYIYVPVSMVDSYKEAKNWTVFADQIRAIEDYPDICGEG